MKLLAACMSLVSLALLSGCTGNTDDEFTEEAQGALLDTNALDSNALDSNALDSNALDSNALDSNALDSNALDSNALSAIQNPTATGTESRRLMRYMVTCALKPSDTFEFSWTDNDGVVHDETYVGYLGLAPEWATGPLSNRGKQMVSACLAAHVNYYSVPVVISIRSGEAPLRLHPNSNELCAYPDVEGAFWGDIWSADRKVYACYNGSKVNNSRAHMRDCATGHVNADGSISECGIIEIVGECKSVCKKFNKSRGYYEDCRKNPGGNNQRTDLVITTALP
jgi:hypothetical protein